MTQDEVDRALATILISVAVAAAILAISKVHAYELIKQGKLEAVDVGLGQRPSYRVKSESVRRFLEGVA